MRALASSTLFPAAFSCTRMVTRFGRAPSLRAKEVRDHVYTKCLAAFQNY